MTEERPAKIHFSLDLGDRTMQASAEVPPEQMALPAMLPVLYAFEDALMTAAVSLAGPDGKTVTCRKGCGACCRQMVPVSEAEARSLSDLVDGLPEERREAIQARFREALAKLDAEGLRQRLEAIPADAAEREELAMAYFRLAIPCPFLEEESCSIYDSRPMICREYLVRSPAAECEDPSPERIDRVPTIAKGSQVLYSWVRGEPRYLPLVRALEWAAKNPHVLYPVAPGPEFFRAFLNAIQRQIRTRMARTPDGRASGNPRPPEN